MKMNQAVRMLLASVVLAGMTGCCAMFNYVSETKTCQNTPSSSTGKELVELKEAKDKGALSEAEYNQCKKDLLSRHVAVTTNAPAATAEK